MLSRREKIWEMKKSSELKVGDIVRVLPNERVPADMILLYTMFIFQINYHKTLNI